MISLIKNFLNNILYVRLGDNTAILYSPKTEHSKTYCSDHSFSNERIAVSSFVVAQDFLTRAIKDFYSEDFFQLSPSVIMHQEYKSEGGLGEVEIKVLQELALASGARKVYVWEGNKLSKKQLDGGVYKQR